VHGQNHFKFNLLEIYGLFGRILLYSANIHGTRCSKAVFFVVRQWYI